MRPIAEHLKAQKSRPIDEAPWRNSGHSIVSMHAFTLLILAPLSAASPLQSFFKLLLFPPMPLSWNEIKTHAALDRAVDRAYRSAPIETERARLEFLFYLYQSITTLYPEKSKKRGRRKTTPTVPP